MPKILTKLKISGVHFVDKGASGDDEDRPSIAIWKRKERQTMTAEQAIAKFAKLELPENAQAILEEIQGKLKPEQWAVLELLFAQAGGVPAPEPTKEPEPKAEPEPMAEAEGDMPPTDPEADPETEKEEDEEAMKSLAKKHPEIAAVLKAQEDRIAKAEKRADESEKRAEVEIEKRELAEMVEIAKSMPAIPGDTLEIAKKLQVFKTMLTPEEFAKHLEGQRAIDKALRANGSILKAVGTGGSDHQGEAAAELRKIADKLQESDPKLNKRVAMAKARRANPALSKRMTEESREAAQG